MKMFRSYSTLLCITAPSHSKAACCAEPQQRSTEECIEHRWGDRRGCARWVGVGCAGCAGWAGRALGHRARAAWPARWASRQLWRPGTGHVSDLPWPISHHVVTTLKQLKCVKGKVQRIVVDDLDSSRTCTRKQMVSAPSHKSDQTEQIPCNTWSTTV